MSKTIIREQRENDHQEFEAVMRLTPEQFEELLSVISPIITRQDTSMHAALPARLRLEITLAFIASDIGCCQLCSAFRSHQFQI